LSKSVTLLTCMAEAGTQGLEADKLEVFPNPNNGFFTVRTSIAGDYEICNAVGQTVERFNVNNGNAFTHSLNGLSAGIYYVRNLNNDAQIQRVIVIE